MQSKTSNTKANAPTAGTVEASVVHKSHPAKGKILMANTSTMPAVYKFGDMPVRVLQRGGDPWFVAADVCKALSIDATAIRKLSEDEKGLHSMQTLGGTQELAIVSEAGMYTLVLRCRDAVNPGTVPYKFRRWVTGEVIPSVRKTGAYTAPRPYNPAIDYDRISPAQAQDLKDIVHAIVEAGIQGYGETWNRLHRKFKVNSYLELPATRHLEARDYLIAKLPKGYAPEVVDPEPAPALKFPKKQAQDISERLGRVMYLFHPFSSQFNDLNGVYRLLQGRCPVTGLEEKGYVPLLAA